MKMMENDEDNEKDEQFTLKSYKLEETEGKRNGI